MNAVADDPAALTSPDQPPLQATWLPLALLRPNRWNRKHFDSKRFDELVESVKAHGVVQPIVVRPLPGAPAGQPQYEIVAGERRWRASQAAGRASVPAWLRDYTDPQVIELVLVENVHREDLNPLDEAQAYAELLGLPYGQGYTSVDELAQRVGLSKSHVYQRLKLLDLCEAGKEAMLAGMLKASIAVAIARLASPQDQAEAVAHVVQGWGGEPYTHRNALDYLQKTFMLRLDKAPFDVTATYAGLGPCGACHKRTGANMELFGEVSGADHCQDRKCFELKTEAAHQRALEDARAAGHKVVGGDEARAILPVPGGQPVGHQFWDRPCPAFTDSTKSLRELLGLNFRGVVVLDHPVTETAIAVVPDERVKRALKAKSLLRADKPRAAAAEPDEDTSRVPAAPAGTPAPAPKARTEALLEAEVATRTGELFGRRLFIALHEAMCQGGELPLQGLRLACGFMNSGGSAEAAQLLYEAHGWPFPANVDDDLRRRIAQADAGLLGLLLVEAAVIDELTTPLTLPAELEDSGVLDLALSCGLDIGELRDEAEAEARRELQADALGATEAFIEAHGSTP